MHASDAAATAVTVQAKAVGDITEMIQESE